MEQRIFLIILWSYFFVSLDLLVHLIDGEDRWSQYIFELRFVVRLVVCGLGYAMLVLS